MCISPTIHHLSTLYLTAEPVPADSSILDYVKDRTDHQCHAVLCTQIILNYGCFFLFLP